MSGEARRRFNGRLALQGGRAQNGPVPVSSYHFLQGPLVAVAALAVIILICRWVFSTDHRPARAATPSAPTTPADYGLLEPVTRAPTDADARALQRRLHEAGIRSTVSGSADGVDVLVFARDAARARDLVRS